MKDKSKSWKERFESARAEGAREMFSEYEWKQIIMALSDRRQKLEREIPDSPYGMALDEQIKDIEKLEEKIQSLKNN